MYKINERIITFLPWEDIEEEAKKQIENISSMPFIFHHVAVMPDCHVGKGATVGTVIATKNALIPAAVGVDIGCGMMAVKTPFTKEMFLKGNLLSIRQGIERRIPLSAGRYNSKFTESALRRVATLEEDAKEIGFTPESVAGKWKEQLGSLGSGNHFIEISVDEEDSVWVVLHSGSRGIGNKTAQRHIDVAKNLMETFHISLPDPDLAYLPQGTKEFSAYLKELNWCQKFALLNREEMMDRVLTELSFQFFNKADEPLELERIMCHHNFTQMENHLGQNVWITRKGAIAADEGMRGIVPGSMGTSTYLVEGLGNPMSFNSSPHGAGRRFSRGTARRTFTMEQLGQAMVGIEWNPSEAFLDEIPGAYKDIETVMAQSNSLIKVQHTLHQLINVKGD